MKGQKNIFQTNGIRKQAGIGTLIFEKKKKDYKLKLVRSVKEEHRILINESINQENITILSMYMPNSCAYNFIKSTLIELKTKIITNPIIVGDLNTLFYPVGRSPGPKQRETS